jgi:hypothetical protein
MLLSAWQKAELHHRRMSPSWVAHLPWGHRHRITDGDDGAALASPQDIVDLAELFFTRCRPGLPSSAAWRKPDGRSWPVNGQFLDARLPMAGRLPGRSAAAGVCQPV